MSNVSPVFVNDYAMTMYDTFGGENSDRIQHGPNEILVHHIVIAKDGTPFDISWDQWDSFVDVSCQPQIAFIENV
jgi:hypothetical protein